MMKRLEDSQQDYLTAKRKRDILLGFIGLTYWSVIPDVKMEIM